MTEIRGPRTARRFRSGRVCRDCRAQVVKSGEDILDFDVPQALRVEITMPKRFTVSARGTVRQNPGVWITDCHGWIDATEKTNGRKVDSRGQMHRPGINRNQSPRFSHQCRELMDGRLARQIDKLTCRQIQWFSECANINDGCGAREICSQLFPRLRRPGFAKNIRARRSVDEDEGTR